MIVLKTSEEIVKMRAAGAVVYEALQAMKAAIEPGVSTTNDLELAAVKVMGAHGADSAFLGYAPVDIRPIRHIHASA